MIDEILKTLIIGIPNFAGLLAGLWLMYNMAEKLRLQNQELQLAIIERDKRCSESEQVKSAKREFSDERGLPRGTSQDENSELLTVANDTN